MNAPPCYGFVWIGQALCHCDHCGRPKWEHTHVDTHRTGTPLGHTFRKFISPSQRELMRLRWVYTMLVAPTYCSRHQRSEYGGLSELQVLERIDEIRHVDY